MVVWTAVIMRTGMILLFLGCALARLNAQSDVSGTVRDSSGAAIEGADVTLTAGNYRASATTNLSGAFTFNGVPGESGTIEARALGFVTRQEKWIAGHTAALVLAPATVLQQVTVTANRTGTRLLDTPTSVVILSPAAIAASGALTTDDLLRQVPDFSLFRRTDSRTANPTSQGVSLRGLGASGASRALVLADGFPLNDPFGGWVFWDRVPRAEIERIEVASGGASHLYGSDALGGVINVFRKPVDESALYLETSYGNLNTPDLSFSGSKAAGPWAGQIAGDFFHTDGYVGVPRDLRGAVDTQVASEHATGEAAGQRRFSFGNVFARGSLLGEQRENGTPLQTNSATIRELDVGANLQSQAWGNLALRGYATRERYFQSFSSIADDRSSESLANLQRVPSQEVGFSAQWTRAVGAQQNLLAGVDETNVHGESDERGFFHGAPTTVSFVGGRQANWGGYLEDMLRITSRLLLTVSGRVDQWSNFSAFAARLPVGGGPGTITAFRDRSETFFSPRLALLHKLSSHVTLTASGYRSFRAPTLNELYRNFRVGNVVTKANDQLRAERLSAGEAGAIVSGWEQRLMVRGNFFWNEITRPIANLTLSSTPDLITRQRQNLGRTRSRGVEVEANAQVTSSLTISGGYALTDATVTAFPADPRLVGRRLPQVPRHVFTLQAQYAKTWGTLGVQGRFSGVQFDDDRNTLPLRRYFTLDAFASHALRPHLEVFAAAENLTSQRYDVARTPVLTVGPPIMARVGLRVWAGRR
jgi:outer membrane receptor protein involved in Fe transport